MDKYLAVFLPLCCFLFLAACGGSGGGGMPTPPPVSTPPPPPPPNPAPPPPAPPSGGAFDTAEFRAGNGLLNSGAIAAYNEGASGAGIVVAVIDSGIDASHPDLDDNILPASKDIIASRNQLFDSQIPHGTAVAAIIAAEKNDIGIHGIAFNAKILAIRSDDPNDANPPTSGNFLYNDMARAVDFAVEQGARVINISISGETPFTPALNAALDRAAATDIAIILISGNDSLTRPHNSTLNYITGENPDGRVIVAGAGNPDLTLWSGSNRAAGVESVFLVAPGNQVFSYFPGTTAVTLAGTSFAAPHIAGAAALLMENFPNLTAREVISLLLDTATDLGSLGTDARFGRGFLNLAAAFAPVGTTSVATAFGGSAPLINSAWLSGDAGGNALFLNKAARSLLSRAIFFDSYNRVYRADLSRSIQNTASGFQLETSLAAEQKQRSGMLALGYGNSLRYSYQDNDGLLASNHKPGFVDGRDTFSLRENRRLENVSLAYSHLIGERTRVSIANGGSVTDLMSARSDRSRYLGFHTQKTSGAPFANLTDANAGMSIDHILTGKTSVQFSIAKGERDIGRAEGPAKRSMATLGINQRIASNVSLILQIGAMNEEQSFLGARFGGAFGTVHQASTGFLTLATNAGFAQWHLSATGSLGHTSLDYDSGLVHSVSTITTSAFAFNIMHDAPANMGGTFGFAISQPLRIEKGGGTLEVATSFDYSTDSIIFERQALSFQPDGREIDFELRYALHQLGGVDLGTSLIYRLDPGHSARTPNEAAIAFSLRTTF